jgi:hypothetical protein
VRRNAVSTLGTRRAVPMARFDRLPPELRAWLKRAALPWSVRAVERLWERALREARGDRGAALARLDAAERAALRRDAARVWGPEYPA